jgi:sugar lactone lactonase YvrE
MAGLRSGRAFAFSLLVVLGIHGAVAQMVRVPAIRTVAGNGTQGFSGDGAAATSAELNVPGGVAVDNAGNLHIADTYNNRIRKVAAGTGIITTEAGNGTQGFSGDGGAATSAEFYYPDGVAVDSAGNLYIAESGNERVRKVTASTGTITTIAGNGTAGFSGDGAAATSAELFNPVGVAVDSAGNLYIVDSYNQRIRKVAAGTGIITTVAGNGTGSFSGDGAAATSAGLYFPQGVAVDSAGNLYIADFDNRRIRKVAAGTGIITTVAGNGTAGFSGDGLVATFAELQGPTGVAVDSAGNLYIADFDNNRIRKVVAGTGIITTVAGNGTAGFGGDGGAATSAELNGPQGVAVDSAGNLYFSDNVLIRRVDSATGSEHLPNTNVGSNSIPVNVLLQPTTNLTLSSITAAVSQGGVQEYTVGTISGCTLSPTFTLSPANICVVPITFSPGYPGERDVALTAVTTQGTASFGLSGIGQGPLAALTPGIISSVAGNGTAGFSGDGGAATSAELTDPYGVAVDSAGNLYIADLNNNRIRKVAAGTGVITTVAGNGTGSFSGDGAAATSAELKGPSGAAVDSAGNLYIADLSNNRIRKVAASTGVITTVAGNGTAGFSGDGGAAASAELLSPWGVAVDSAGNLYIADSGNDRIRKVAASTGMITTVAGNGALGFSGDGGPATSAELYAPRGVAVDSTGNLYIAESSNQRIRKVAAGTGIITTVAGNGTAGFSGDGGAATSAELDSPWSVAVDSAGNLYIAESFYSHIRKVTASNGIITTVAGNGTAGLSGDGGAATSAELNGPQSVAVDSAGNLYIADAQNNVIRRVAVNASALSFTATSEGSISSDSPKSVRLGNSGNMALSFPAPTSGYNPAVSSVNFVLDGGASTTCPYEASTSAAGTLAAGAECTFGFYFYPQQYGSLTATATVADTSPGSSTQTISLSGATTQTGTAQSITFPQPANTTYPGSATLNATASSGLPVTYALVSGPATLSSSTLSYTGTGTVTVMASQAGNSTYAPATSVTINISVVLAQSTATWEPSALKIYSGTALGSSILDATDSIPATIAYSAFLMPSGTPSAVTTSTVLVQGSYGLEALITPTNTAYGAELLELPFTVQNMNVFIAGQHLNAGTITSLFNNGTQQSGATNGGGIGAAVDSSGSVWSINADGSGVSKFTDAGAISANYSGVAGIHTATALAIDGSGTVWIANGNGTVSALNSKGSAALANGTPVAAGGNLNAPASVSVDTAGSLWIANTGNNTVTEVLGVAAPVVTPIAAGVYYNTLGTRP